MAALTWAETERPRGELVTNASMVFTLLGINFGLDVKKAVHISGVDNWRCDTLSRMSESEGGIHEAFNKIDMGSTREVNLQDNCHVQKLLESCNPAKCVMGEEVFLEFWGGIRDAIKEIEKEAANPAPVPHLS